MAHPCLAGMNGSLTHTPLHPPLPIVCLPKRLFRIVPLDRLGQTKVSEACIRPGGLSMKAGKAAGTIRITH